MQRENIQYLINYQMLWTQRKEWEEGKEKEVGEEVRRSVTQEPGHQGRLLQTLLITVGVTMDR